MVRMIGLQLLCLCAVLDTVLSASGFNASLTYSGSYWIQIHGKQWFLSVPPFVVANNVRYSVTAAVPFHGEYPDFDRELLHKNTESTQGSDSLGTFKSMKQEYFAGDTRMDVGVRAYDSAVVFTQTFPYGLSNSKVPDARPIVSGFPAFNWNWIFTTSTPSGYLTFSGPLTGSDAVFLNQWNPNNQTLPVGMLASGPLCLFNASGSDAVVISPLTQTMHVSPWHRVWNLTFITEGQSYWGLDRDLQTVPAGFKAEVMMVYSPNGIGKALEEWGRLYRQYNQATSTSQPPPPPPAHSVALDSMGYWTGQGSYYSGNTTTNTTYEDILLDVAKTAVNESVPLGFLELDNWWYDSHNGTPEAVVTWEANNQSLPSGLGVFQKKLGLPLAAVLGWWSCNTTYAEQNNGTYAFITEGDYALPMQKEFWTDLFRNASQSNIKHVILDNMATQYFGITALQTQVGLASDWLRNVSSAAYDAGITLTLSQALPRMVMEASQYPAVVQVRVSAPYMDGSTNSTDQWKIGVTSALARALGLAAFKDTFWGHAHEEGNPYDGEEPNPILQAVVATLSMGSVVPGDSKQLLASSSLHRCCRSDGLVLKPSLPATAIDSQLTQTAVNRSDRFVAQIWSSLSTIDVFTGVNGTSSYTQGVILAADVPDSVNVTPSAAFPGVYAQATNLRAGSWVQGKAAFWREFSESQPLSIMPAQCSIAPSSALPCLFHVSPPLFLNGGKTMIHLGGEDKFVPLSPQRVKVINITDDATFTLTLQGQPGENVTMLYYVNNVGRSFSATIAPGGVTNVELNVTPPVTTSTAVVTSEPMTTVTTPPGGNAARTRAATSGSLLSVFIVSFLVALLK